jgi:hypothetical protein
MFRNELLPLRWRAGGQPLTPWSRVYGSDVARKPQDYDTLLCLSQLHDSVIKEMHETIEFRFN